MKCEVVFEQGDGAFEDGLLITDTTFGVFDGATGLWPTAPGARTGGQRAADLVRRTVDAHQGDLKGALLKANQHLRDAMVAEGVDLNNKLQLWSTTAAMVRISNDVCEWAQVGDSPVVFLYKDGTLDIFVEPVDHDQEWLVVWKKFADEGKRELKTNPQMRALLEQVRRKMNIDYGGISGEEFERFICCGEVPLSRVDTILIFTDGLRILEPDASRFSDIKSIIRLFKEGGLRRVHAEVRSIEARDPECIRFPRYKQHDDIAAIALSWTAKGAV
jgi:serine/threonine protein phosphatase PrpC